jgi:hypothetical protein
MNSPGRNGEPPSGADGFPSFTVPDDISELDMEVQQYRREVRRARRRARWTGVLLWPFRVIRRGFRRVARLLFHRADPKE